MSSSTASKLDQLAGLDSAKRVIRSLASGSDRGGKGVHAVLLYGARGAGKTHLARMLAQAWMCTNPTDDGADGTCRSCAAFERESCADFLLIAPTGASSNIRTNAITVDSDKTGPVPLLEFFRTRPLMARNRVVMIRHADRMNGSANNALLKTLEEPSPYAKLVLTTDSIGAIPATILSRCLGVACSLPDRAALGELYPEATEDDLILSGRAPGRTGSILKNAAPYRSIVRFARELPSRRPEEALVVSEGFRGLAEELESALGVGIRSANTEALEALATVFAQDPEIPPVWTHHALEAHRRIIGNANPTFVFDALFTCLLRTN